jgi:hypothetical protein
MYQVDYQKRVKNRLNDTGNPIVSFTLAQRTDSGLQQYINGSMLLDTGADISSINTKIAIEYNFPIVSHEATVIFGFNDAARIIAVLKKCGLSDKEVKEYTSRFSGRNKELLQALQNDYGIDDAGIVCDLRKVSMAYLYGFVIFDAIIATPCDRKAIVAEVLGMNVLEKLHFGFDLEGKWLYLSKNSDNNISNVKDEYRCGEVGMLDENAKSLLVKYDRL